MIFFSQIIPNYLFFIVQDTYSNLYVYSSINYKPFISTIIYCDISLFEAVRPIDFSHESIRSLISSVYVTSHFFKP